MSIAKNTKETFLEEIIDNLNGNKRELPIDCKPRTREEVLLAEIEKNTRNMQSGEGGVSGLSTNVINFDGLMLVRKKGSEPNNFNDGTVLLNTYNRRINVYKDSGLDENSDYYYALYVFNGADEVGKPKIAKVVTTIDFKGIRIIRKEGSKPVNQFDGTVILEQATTTLTKFTDVTAEKNKNYYYGLYIYNSKNEYGEAAILNVVTPPPINFKGIHIIRKEGSEPVNQFDGTTILKSNTITQTTFKDTTVPKFEGVTYYYKIFIYNELGEYDNGVSLKVEL